MIDTLTYDVKFYAILENIWQTKLRHAKEHYFITEDSGIVEQNPQSCTKCLDRVKTEAWPEKLLKLELGLIFHIAYIERISLLCMSFQISACHFT